MVLTQKDIISKSPGKYCASSQTLKKIEIKKYIYFSRIELKFGAKVGGIGFAMSNIISKIWIIHFSMNISQEIYKINVFKTLTTNATQNFEMVEKNGPN